MKVLNVVQPYRYLDVWVFDDPRVGLSAEPFVGGADAMIDRVTSHIPDAKHGFRMVFSGSPFPDYHYKLDWRAERSCGNVYYSDDLGIEGWLCPALLRYFEERPSNIYLQVEAVAGGTNVAG